MEKPAYLECAGAQLRLEAVTQRQIVTCRDRPEADLRARSKFHIHDQLATERLALPEPIQRCTELFVQGVPVPVRRPCEGVSSIRNATDSHVTTHYAQPCDSMFC